MFAMGLLILEHFFYSAGQKTWDSSMQREIPKKSYYIPYVYLSPTIAVVLPPFSKIKRNG